MGRGEASRRACIPGDDELLGQKMRLGHRWRRRCGWCDCRRGWQRLSIADDGDVGECDRRERLVVPVAFDPCDRSRYKDGVSVALTEDGVFSIEIGLCDFGDEELRSVGVGPCVRHGEASRNVEDQARSVFIVKEVSRVSCSIPSMISPLDHEAWNDAVEGGAIVEALAMHLLPRRGVGPILGALGECDEVSGCERRFFAEEFAGESSHAGVEHNGRSGRRRGRRWSIRGAWSIWKLTWRGCCLTCWRSGGRGGCDLAVDGRGRDEERSEENDAEA